MNNILLSYVYFYFKPLSFFFHWIYIFSNIYIIQKHNLLLQALEPQEPRVLNNAIIFIIGFLNRFSWYLRSKLCFRSFGRMCALKGILILLFKILLLKCIYFRSLCYTWILRVNRICRFIDHTCLWDCVPYNRDEKKKQYFVNFSALSSSFSSFVSWKSFFEVLHM